LLFWRGRVFVTDEFQKIYGQKQSRNAARRIT
jgi:hypothetical protein